MKLKYLMALAAAVAGWGGSLIAAEPAGDGGDRLRAALRDTTLQLRTAQSDLANLQATQAAIAEEKKSVLDKYEALKKQVIADRSAADKSSATLTAQLAGEKTQVARMETALAAAKAEAEKNGQAASLAETQGAKLNEQNIELQRRVADREAKNLALFLLGNEILSRYEEFSLGNALRAKEPFVGSARTKLENLVQDYQDKLADQRVRP